MELRSWTRTARGRCSSGFIEGHCERQIPNSTPDSNEAQMNAQVKELTRSLVVLVVALSFCMSVQGAEASAAARSWWSAAVESRHADAGQNWPELARALTEVVPAQRVGLQYRIENLPATVCQAFSYSFLLN